MKKIMIPRMICAKPRTTALESVSKGIWRNKGVHLVKRSTSVSSAASTVRRLTQISYTPFGSLHSTEKAANSISRYPSTATIFFQSAFCAAERPPVRLPAATQRCQRPGLIDHFMFNHNIIMLCHSLKQRVG